MSADVKGPTFSPHLAPPSGLSDTPHAEPKVLAQRLLEEAVRTRTPALAGQAELFRTYLQREVDEFLAQHPSASEKELKAFVQAKDAQHFKSLALGGFSRDYLSRQLQQRLGGKG